MGVRQVWNFPEYAGLHFYHHETMNLIPDTTVSVTVNLTNGKTDTLTVTVPADKMSHKLVADTVETTYGTNNIVDFSIND